MDVYELIHFTNCHIYVCVHACVREESVKNASLAAVKAMRAYHSSHSALSSFVGFPSHPC